MHSPKSQRFLTRLKHAMPVARNSYLMAKLMWTCKSLRSSWPPGWSDHRAETKKSRLSILLLMKLYAMIIPSVAYLWRSRMHTRSSYRTYKTVATSTSHKSKCRSPILPQIGKTQSTIGFARSKLLYKRPSRLCRNKSRPKAALSGSFNPKSRRLRIKARLSIQWKRRSKL